MPKSYVTRSSCDDKSLELSGCPLLLHEVQPQYANYMTEGGKDAIKKRGDHNWDMERMQFEKQRGNISGQNDYVNLDTKVDSIQEAMGSNSGNEPITNSDNIHIEYNKGQKSIEKEKDS